MDIHPSALYLALNSDLASYFTSQSYLSLQDCFKSNQIAAAFALQGSLVSKLGSSKGSDACDAKAFAKWAQTNERCAVWKPPVYGVSDSDDLLWGEFRKAVYEFFTLPDYRLLIESLEQVALKGSHGPGSSNGIAETSHYDKTYQGGLTMTSEVLYDAYRQAYCRFPDHLTAVDYGIRLGGKPRLLEESAIFFVPKNADISRLAATEPSLNMYFQKGISVLLERRLNELWGLDLSVQPIKNRVLARLGSIDGSFATIDLSSASDSISHNLIESVVPRGVYDILARVRTPYMLLKNGERVKLDMFSTMGNGFTFSLQTVIFACVVVAAYRISGIRPRKGAPASYWSVQDQNDVGTVDQTGNFAVFGDDIIVRREAFGLVSSLLRILGCSLNSKKTFVEGPFRESCGGDYYNGHPVRGVYIKLLETHNHAYNAINELVDWSTRHRIPLKSTVRLILRAIPKKDRLYVPPCEQYDAGLHVPLEFFKWVGENPLRSADFVGTRFVYKASCPKVSRVRIRYTDLPIGITFITLRQDTRRKIGLIVNELGLYQCFLSGHLYQGSWAVRQPTQIYRTIRKVTPNWGNRPGASVNWLGPWTTMACSLLI